MRISDWSSDVCSSDLFPEVGRARAQILAKIGQLGLAQLLKARHAVGDEHPFMNDCVECRVVQQDRRGPKVRRNTRRHGFASVADDATLVIDVGSSRSGRGAGAILRAVDRAGFMNRTSAGWGKR